MAAGAWLAAVPPAVAQQANGTAPPVAIYEPPAVDVQPRLINSAAIGRQLTERYPPALMAGRISGAVLLRFRVLANGSVDSISTVQATDTAFVEPAMAIGRQLFFAPAMVGVRPVTIWYTFDLRFLPTRRMRPDPGGRQPVLRNGVEVDRRIAALHPPALLAGKVAGAVLLRIKILADGRVDSASVLPLHATNAAFVEAATAVARRMTFTPATVGGRPVAYWHSFNIRFRPPVERTTAPDEGTYELAVVEEMPRLRNAEEVARRIAAAYPRVLTDSGVVGRVVLRFRLLENGRVLPESVSVPQASHPALVEPAIAIAREMRFAPAKVGGRPVKVWIELPIGFPPPPQPAQGDASGTGTPARP